MGSCRESESIGYKSAVETGLNPTKIYRNPVETRLTLSETQGICQNLFLKPRRFYIYIDRSETCSTPISLRCKSRLLLSTIDGRVIKRIGYSIHHLLVTGIELGIGTTLHPHMTLIGIAHSCKIRRQPSITNDKTS